MSVTSLTQHPTTDRELLALMSAILWGHASGNVESAVGIALKILWAVDALEKPAPERA